MVIYESDGTITWTFLVKRDKPKGEKLILQNDCNLVLRTNDQTVVWASGSKRRCQAGKKSESLPSGSVL